MNAPVTVLKEAKISQIQNLPSVYLSKRGNIGHTFKDSPEKCGKFPYLFDIQFSNSYWQVMEHKTSQFYFYNAYLDVREGNALGPSVRILAMSNSLKPRNKICQLWFEGSLAPVESKVVNFEDGGKVFRMRNPLLDDTNNGVNLLVPYLMQCLLPESHKNQTPTSVSVVSKSCQKATNNLKVQYNPQPEGEPKKQFAVCLKAITVLNDESEELIEWIEILRAYGVDKVFFYVLEVHEKMLKVK